VAEVGRKIPVAVFHIYCVCHEREGGAQKKKKYGFRFETLDEDAVEEGDERPDRLEGSLGRLFAT
jgi:hypothetical protein